MATEQQEVPKLLVHPLSKKEKSFCEIYAQCRVSGIDAVYEAGYKPKNKNTAYSIASENLRKPKIISYIKSLYREYKFTDEDVMKEHLFLIQQHNNLSVKAKAIDIYYKKNGFYNSNVKERDPVTVVIKKY